MTDTLDLPIVASSAITPEWMTAALRKAGHPVDKTRAAAQE